MRTIRNAPFAIRVVERREGKGAIIYRRRSDNNGQDRLQRVSQLSALGFTAGTPLLREAVLKSTVGDTKPRSGNGNGKYDLFELIPGKFYPLDADWGAKTACFALVSAGLRNAERLLRAATHMRNSDPTEAAWWLGLLTKNGSRRPLRALRILTEAVE